MKEKITSSYHIFFIVLLLTIANQPITAQVSNKLTLKIVAPAKELNNVTSYRQFITGMTCTSCSVTINERAVKVYSTGAFAFQTDIQPGDTSFAIVATDGKTVLKKIIKYHFELPQKPKAVATPSIESIQTFPEGNLSLQPGDKIQIKVKAFPGSKMYSYNNTVLFEQPDSIAGISGIYQGEYIIQPTDTFNAIPFPILLTTVNGEVVERKTSAFFSVFKPSYMLLSTKGRLAHLEYGLGDDRLGGAKIGYLDSNIILKATGKFGKDYRIQLASNQNAYIEDDLVTAMPKGIFEPKSLTGNITLTGDAKYDYVQIALGSKLPYQSKQLLDPSRIVVDIFGATSNTNWIQQFESAKEVASIIYEQLQDDVFRVIIQLKHKQHWGHSLFYRGNMLMIKVRQQPLADLSKLVIAIDAGHGGTNPGASGITGAIEKDLTLAVSLKLQQALEKEGAKVIMTRTKEQFFDNKERILFFRDSTPDLLISMHLNSSADPINTGGTGTFYKYIGFRPLSYFIYKRMLELGLKDYANTGSFNFMLNSPTEYPNALVEMLFLSNPAEEEKILDVSFQQQVVEKIVLGVKDFLHAAK